MRAALLALLLAATAQAQDADATLAAETDPAVGRLNRAGYNTRHHCTAALVGPSEAVTARHCVEGPAPEELRLVLGYDRGGYAELRRVASVAMSDSADVARLCLDAPSGARPLPASAGRPAPAGAVVRGYPRTRPHAQDLRRCRLSPLAGRPLAALDCPLEQGFSGAPVRSPGELGPVIGVASASGPSGSVVALLGGAARGRLPGRPRLGPRADA